MKKSLRWLMPLLLALPIILIGAFVALRWGSDLGKLVDIALKAVLVP